MDIDRHIDKVLSSCLVEEDYNMVYNYIADLVDQINAGFEEKQMDEETITDLHNEIEELREQLND